MCMVLVTVSDCLSMLFLVVTNFGHISILVLSTLSIKGRVILSDFEIIPIKLILTEALIPLHGVRSGMSLPQLKPPVPFDFKVPDAWPRWKRRF